MSSSRTSGEVDQAQVQEKVLQERLQILVERLRWSYAALWTLNPNSRVLQWKRGHYSCQPVQTGMASSELKQQLTWYAQQFYTTYRLCSFTPGTGFVGRANLEGRRIWLSGDSVCQNAGSLEQSQFLSYANIKTVMCIPWLDSVLELGTVANSAGEKLQLMDQIQEVLARGLLMADVVPPLHKDDNVAGFAAGHDKTSSSSPAAAVHRDQSSEAQSLPLSYLDQPCSSSFDINLSDEVWRSDMIFMGEQESNLPDLTAAPWRDVDNQSHIVNAVQHASTSHGLVRSSQAADQYGSRSNAFTGTTVHAAASCCSTSVSSQGVDQYSNSFSARAATANSISPELLHHHIMQSLSSPVSLSTAPDRTSTTGQPQHEIQLHLQDISAYNIKQEMHVTDQARNQNNNLRRTFSCGDQYEVQKALSLLEAQEMQQQELDPVSQVDNITDRSNVSFHSWRHGHDPSLNIDSPNRGTMNILSKQAFKFPRAHQLLQRRHTLPAIEVLKELEAYHEEAANSNMINPSEPGTSTTAHVQVNTPSFRGRPRGKSSGGGVGVQVAAGHAEAALNHMLAERRRRVKQKEHFATLRRLVPIISKADKASTLVDAIVYLKDLQNTIEEMRANKDDLVQRCNDLASKCQKLEEQNRELVVILSTSDKPPSDIDHLKLYSTKSI